MQASNVTKTGEGIWRHFGGNSKNLLVHATSFEGIFQKMGESPISFPVLALGGVNIYQIIGILATFLKCKVTKVFRCLWAPGMGDKFKLLDTGKLLGCAGWGASDMQNMITMHSTAHLPQSLDITTIYSNAHLLWNVSTPTMRRKVLLGLNYLIENRCWPKNAFKFV